MSFKKTALSVLSLAVRASIGIVATSVITAAIAAPADTKRYIVMYKPGTAESTGAAVASFKGQVHHQIHGTNAVVVEMPSSERSQLERHPNVEFVEEDLKRYPMSGSTPSTGSPYLLGQQVPYGIKMVQADQLPNGDAFAGNRKVCIIDSGYDLSHEDLAGNSVTGEYDSGTGWWYADENHHGSHVAGTIAAINNSGTGVVGVNANKKLKLHIVKVFGADGWAYSSSLTAAANKCASAGANVISMSLGGAGKTKTEERAFATLANNGILSIAAAGNDGTTTLSYPASYPSVMSVAAIDENKQWASFSQYNSDVEISAPGVNVLSTVPMGSGTASALSVGSTVYAPGGMDGSPRLTRTAPLADFGIGNAVNSAMSGKICLIARGTVDFATKVTNCQSSGGVGAIVYNNAAGGFGGTLGTTATSIPSVTASDTEGASLKLKLGQSATVAVTPTNYAYFDGTSMATPHVSAVAALVWSYFPSCTGAQIRATLTKSAENLGPTGRDTKFGYGLVRARAAYDRINSLGCNN